MVSLNTLKKGQLRVLIKESLTEIFDSKPFKTDFTFRKFDESIKTPSFKDPKGNIIEIYFYKDGNNTYLLDFTVNGNSFKARDVKYTLTEYSQLLATVAKATSLFLQEYQPLGLVLSGVDDFKKMDRKSQAKGQKDRLYKYFITKLDDNPDYAVGQVEGGGLALSRKPGSEE